MIESEPQQPTEEAEWGFRVWSQPREGYHGLGQSEMNGNISVHPVELSSVDKKNYSVSVYFTLLLPMGKLNST